MHTDRLENPFGELPVGEILIGLTEDDPKEGETPAVIGSLALTNLGGIIEIGEGLTIPSDPTDLTTETHEAAFLIDDKTVVVELGKVTQQNLRYEEDVTVGEHIRIRAISQAENDDFVFWIEQLYDCWDGDASFHELLYRKSKEEGAEWVALASPSVARAINGPKKTAEEETHLKDQSQENPHRFDQNRYTTVMGLLAQVGESNRLDTIPSLGQTSFKMITDY